MEDILAGRLMFKEITINYHGKNQKILAEVVDRKVWFKMNSETFCYDVLDLSNRSGKSKNGSAAANDKILAPMPGKITKIFVSEGDQVNKGDALLVMEAMKMEYTLKSDIEATVEKLNSHVNQQVNLGHVLVKLNTQATK